MTSYRTFTVLIQRVHQRLSLVPGTAVQVYNEDHTAELLQDAFDDFAREPGYLWPQFRDWMNGVVLDGTTGTPTTNINSSASSPRVLHEDIIYIWRHGGSRPLTILPDGVNPYTFSAGRAYFEYTNNMQKLWRAWPLTDTGTYTVLLRRLPDLFEANDIVPFDPNVLVEHVAWRLATNDGSNAAQGAMFLNKFEAAWQRLKLGYNSVPVELDPRLATTNDQWTEDPMR